MHYLVGLDIGDKRIGIALSDSLGLAPRAHATVEVGKFFDYFQDLIKEHNCKQVIIGLPKHRDGSDSEQTQKVRNFVEQISTKFADLEFHFEDEVLTSSEAQSRLKSRGIKIQENNKGLIDSEAAAIILEQYFAN